MSYGETVDNFIIVCDEPKVSNANTLAGNWDFDSAGDEAFNKALKLSPDGQLPVTHRLIHTPVNASMKSGVETALIGGVPWLQGFKESEGHTVGSVLVSLGLQEVNWLLLI